MTSGLRGSISTSVTPVCSEVSNALVQVLPPSRVTYRPRSPPSFHNGPCAATQTTFESRGSIAIVEMCSEVFSPMLCQVVPPSSDLYTPSPYCTARCELFSPLPTQIVNGFFGSIVPLPSEYDPSSSKIGFQVVPAFVVFHRPPLA